MPDVQHPYPTTLPDSFGYARDTIASDLLTDIEYMEDETWKIDSALKEGVPVNLTHNKTTLLTAAAVNRNPKALIFLLEHGADPNLLDGHGRSPIMLAVKCGNFDNVRKLYKAGADPDLGAPSAKSAAVALYDKEMIIDLFD